jgi:hypothetical protein
LPDLGVKTLDLPLVSRLRVPPDAGVERPRRLILKLLLPGVNLVGMDLISLRKVVDRGLLPQRCDFSWNRDPAAGLICIQSGL